MWGKRSESPLAARFDHAYAVMMRPKETPTELVLTLAATSVTAAAQTPTSSQPAAKLPFRVQVVADLEWPWAMTFLPDGRMLITEKAGTLLLDSADGQQRTRLLPRASIPPSGPTAIATRLASRLTAAATCGSRRWVPRAATS